MEIPLQLNELLAGHFLCGTCSDVVCQVWACNPVSRAVKSLLNAAQ